MYVSIEVPGHFFTIYVPGFVCFVLYWPKISGERLQDHWSSGYWTAQNIIYVEGLLIENLTKISCLLKSVLYFQKAQNARASLI